MNLKHLLGKQNILNPKGKRYYLFRVLARYFVPFLLARDGYFFWRKAYSSRIESVTLFLLLMSSWLLSWKITNCSNQVKCCPLLVLWLIRMAIKIKNSKFRMIMVNIRLYSQICVWHGLFHTTGITLFYSKELNGTLGFTVGDLQSINE